MFMGVYIIGCAWSCVGASVHISAQIRGYSRHRASKDDAAAFRDGGL